MIKVRILTTGEIQEVTPNVAFDLTDRKVAEVYTGSKSSGQFYQPRVVKPKEENKVIKKDYRHRQMRVSG